MVMFTYGDFLSKGGSEEFSRSALSRRREAVEEASLSSSLLRLNENFRLRHYFLPVRIRDLIQDVIHCLWDARIRPMELSGCLGGKLAQHIPVTHGM
jgi:hypothetical protein